MKSPNKPTPDAETAAGAPSVGPGAAGSDAAHRSAIHVRANSLRASGETAAGGDAIEHVTQAESLAGPHFRPDSFRNTRSPLVGKVAYSPSNPATRPTPMPNRPKGRLVVGMFLLSVFGAALYTVWNATLRFEAYGVVTGRLVDVAPTWSGVIVSVHVREGDEIRQEQLLATLKNLELEHRRAELVDELRVTQAAIDSELAEIRLDSQYRHDQSLMVFVDYWDMQGDLAFEQSQLERYIAERQRLEALMVRERQTVTVDRVEEVVFAEKGHRTKIEKMTKAIEEMRIRVEQMPKMEDARARLHPQQTRLETIQAQMVRLSTMLKQGEIRSPVNGRMIKLHRFSGEYVEQGKPICEVLVDGSLSAVLYVPQADVAKYQLGKVLDVRVSPSTQLTRCEVKRLGDQMEAAPKSLEVYYRQHEQLLPVVLQPLPNTDPDALRLGSELRVPTDWRKWR